MPATDLPLLIEAAQEAGRIARRYFEGTARTWEKPDGSGPVTEADLAVNAMLEATLPPARPAYGWLSEESEDDPSRQDREHIFIVDPIDGTRSFAEGGRTWAHSFAVADRGVVTAAVVFLPMRDLLYCAAQGQGATLNGSPICVSTTSQVADADILAARPNMQPRHWVAGVPPGFTRSYRPSLAYRLALVAQGRFDGMLTFRPSWEWDIAAGDLIIREAGGTTTDKSGAPLRFNTPGAQVDGVIAATPPVHRNLLGALATGTSPDPASA